MGLNTSTGRLFLAAVPDADTARRIHRLAVALKRAHGFDGRIIEPERLHVSLFFLGELPEPIARIACESAAEVRAPPFQVLFDRSVTFRGKPGNRPFVLTGDDGLDRLKSFRRTLGVAMARKGLRFLAKKEFTPHITLMYAEHDVEEHPIEPIGWTVNELVLIHSMRGHVHLARWPLRIG
jgi:RNA 2',3'-cyclic 3'-phosphodiesterase